jgi:GT2 family glycosyltransferase
MTASYSAPASRLAACPCGSGRRWKDCHGALAAVAPSLALDDALSQALAAQQALRFDEAERLYRHALALAPDHFDALHMLGVVRLQRADFDEALALIERAQLLRPHDAGARHNRGLAETARDWHAGRAAYVDWVRRCDTPDAATLARWRSDGAGFSRRPLISLVLPTYNSPERWLVACLDSVLAQVYDHWELCIADDASPDPAVRRILDAYAARDRRIRVTYRERNGHIAAASNSALELARGEFVALLDHDDLLPPQALHFVAATIDRSPDAVLLYSDEDKIDEANRRYDPYFKPDWNDDLVAAQNCVSHLGVYRADAARAVGGFREGCEGAQDWDLALRVARAAGPARVVHIPRILYHWRAIEGSTARTMESKDYAAAAQDRAVADHFAARGEAMTLTRVVGGTFIQADPAGAPPVFELVVAARVGDADDVIEAIDAVRAAWEERAPAASSIVVVPVEGAPDAAGWRLSAADAAAIDAAVARVAAHVVVVVDAALVPDADALARLAAHAARPGVGVAGGLLRDRTGRILHAGYVLDPDAVARTAYAGKSPGCLSMGARVELVQTLAAVGQGALAARRDAWLAVGGLSAAPVTWHFRDVDLCLRLGATGARALWHPAAGFEAALVPGAPAGDDALLAGDTAAMRARWGARLAADPAGNPNLSTSPRPFELATMPRLPAHLR